MKLKAVVNCFQNCILAYNSQHVVRDATKPRVVNCFQNCILAYNSQQTNENEEHKQVVNCFQNCILAYNSQPNANRHGRKACCELLSKLYFSL